MATELLQLTVGSLPTGYCWPASPQTFANDFAERLQVQLPSNISFFNFGDTTPAAENRGYPWLRTASGAPDRWYVYFGGNWVWPHPVAASSNERRLWVGDLSALETHDGGASGTVGAASGPMWEEDTGFIGRSPMGPGLIPDTAITLAVAANQGKGEHLQTGEEVGPHGHTVSHPRVEGTGSGNITGNDVLQGDTGTGPQSGTLLVNNNTYASSQEAMTILHPVRGVYIIKRTARVYYKTT